jgi:MSHA biogenesis protein MshO
MIRKSLCQGFSLIEMIATLVLVGIVAVAFGSIVSPAVRGFSVQTQRAELVDAAENALRRMAREIRISVPNGVRISNTASGFFLEILPTVDGGRYCVAALADCSSADMLDFTINDTSFDILGFFQDSGFKASTTNAYRLVIGNTGNEVYSALDADATAVITKTNAAITISTAGGRSHVVMTNARRFSTQSPRQRVFALKTSDVPVTYVCNTTAKTLTRHAGYTLQAAQPTDVSASPLITALSIALVAKDVSGCSVTSTAANVQNSGIVILSLSLTDAAGETVTLMHQAQLDNSQ